jgi:methylmalonyl-CoA/ethylmalonyl-CoA epimerase
MLGPLGQIAVAVRDIERATAFYRDTLGIRLLFRSGGLSFFDCGGLRLMISEPEGKIRGERTEGQDSSPGQEGTGEVEAHAQAKAKASALQTPGADSPAFVLYFRVDDIEAMHRKLSSRGVAFVDRPHLIARLPDHELWLTAFQDGEGNTLALMEERRG